MGAHIERLKDKLANVFERITKYEFDFSIMIATSYLDELISELFKHTFELDRFAKFDQNTKTSVTLNFKIEYLYAKGIIDAKTNDTLSLLRKIRNTLAHQSVIEEKEEKSIDSRIVEIKKICDNGILSRPETIQGITDSRLLVLVPVIENLCLAFINAIHFSNPLIKLGNILYANKGYGTGFIYTTVPEYISERVLHHLEHKYHSLKLDSETYHRHGIQVNF